MLTPAPMKRVNLFILEKDEQNVMRALGRLKLIHLEPAKADVQLPMKEKPNRDKPLEAGRRLLIRIDQLLADFQCSPDGPAAQTPHLTAAEIAAKVRDIEAARNELRRQIDHLDADGKQLDTMIRDLQAFVGLGIPMERINDFSFLHFAIGSLPSTSLGELNDRVGTNVVLMPRARGPEKQQLVAITSKKGRFALETELEKAGFKAERIGPGQKGLADELVALAQDRHVNTDVQRELAQRLREEKADQFASTLRAYRRTVANEIRIIEAEANFAYTDTACYISGWVPADQVNDMTECLLAETAGCAAVEVSDPNPDSEPPSKFQQSGWLRPFTMLVSGYGFPKYREIEPTLFVAATFLLMFGFMFGDAGHGAVLLVAGLVLRLKAAKQKTRDVGVILMACGLASVIAGAVIGSVFGFSPWGHPLPEPMHRIRETMTIAVLGGTAMISLGLVFNIINRLRAGDFSHGIFHRFGLIGAAMYWAVLWLAIRALVWPEEDLPVTAVLWVLAAGSIILFIREPLLVFLDRRKQKKAENLLAALIGAGIELMELFVGYLANSLSFMRLAAYAVSHGFLLLATFQMMRMLGRIEGVGGPLMVLVFVFGNLVIILLEGLIAAIQAMRLEYYEFFSKFFSGTGRAYQPFEAE